MPLAVSSYVDVGGAQWKVLDRHDEQEAMWNTAKYCKMIYACASRGAGKCIVEGSLVTMADGTVRAIENVKADDHVVNVSRHLRRQTAKVVGLIDNGMRPTLNIRLSGRVLPCTDNHPLLVNGNHWVNAGDVRVNDLVAVLRSDPRFGTERMADDDLDFLAMWLAEGAAYTISNQTPAIVDRLHEIAAGWDLTPTSDDGCAWYLKMNAPRHDANLGVRHRARLLLERLGLWGRDSKTKFIPDCVFKLPRDQLARFLSAFYGCDGYCCPKTERGGRVAYTIGTGLANRLMVRQMSALLLKFGIRGSFTHRHHAARSRRTGQRFHSWRLETVCSDGIVRFAEEIGMLGKETVVRRALIAAKALTRPNCNDLLPITEQEFSDHVVIRRYHNLADGDVVWERVVAIEDGGVRQTYDLEVEGEHNFIVEGAVVHNSEMAKRKLAMSLGIRRPWYDPRYFYAAPTYRQVKRVVWQDMLHFVPPAWIAPHGISHSELTIRTIFGSELVLFGLDSPQRLEGVQYDGGIVDECFIFGTPVDTPAGERRIEDIRPGDKVYRLGGVGTVYGISTRQKDTIVKVASNCYTWYCSVNHPFLTKRGWVAAKYLREGDHLVPTAETMRMVRQRVHAESRQPTAVLQSNLCIAESGSRSQLQKTGVVRGNEGSAEGVLGCSLRIAEEAVRAVRQPYSTVGKENEAFLFKGVCRCSSFAAHDGCREKSRSRGRGQSCVGAETRSSQDRVQTVPHEVSTEARSGILFAEVQHDVANVAGGLQTSYDRTSYSCEDDGDYAEAGCGRCFRYGPQVFRRAAVTTATGGRSRAGLDLGLSRSYGSLFTSRSVGLPDCVLDRHCESGCDAGGGGGRARTQKEASTENRRDEDGIPDTVRVESVTIHQRGSPEFDRISGGKDYVNLYDIAVSGHPSFSTHGVIVHNSSDVNHQLVDLAVLPALTHRDGWLWKIGVPKRFGIGAYDFKTQFLRAMKERRAAEREGRIPAEAAFIWPADGIVPQARLDFYRARMDPMDFDEQFGAQWLEVGGGIYHSFSAAEDGSGNVRPCNYRPDFQIYVGMDFNVNPGAITLGHKILEASDGRPANRFEVFDEFHLLNTNTQRMLDTLWNRYGAPGRNHQTGFRFYGDATGKARKTAAATSDYTQIFNDARFRDQPGGRIINWQKSNPPRTDRFACTNALIKNGEGVRRLFVDPRCGNLVDDYMHRSYRERSRELPPDEGMLGHHADSCLIESTPVVTDQGLYPIEQVPAGAMVLTRRGYRRVLWSGMTDDDAQIYRMTYRGGVLNGTADHPVYTDDGFLPLMSLTQFSRVYLLRRKQICQQDLQSYTEILGSNCDAGGELTTLVQLGICEILATCIDKCGLMPTGQFLRDIRSIIVTATASITRWITMNVFQPGIIDDYIARLRTEIQSWCDVALKDSPKLAWRRNGGIDLQRAEYGIGRTRSTSQVCSAAAEFSGTVNTADIGSRFISPQIDSARSSVSRLRGIIAESTTRFAYVNGAAVNSLSTSISRRLAVPDHVVSVLPTGERRPVYNLSVEGQPEFFAGESRQCLVHNCDYIIWRVFPLRLNTQELPEISITLPTPGGVSALAQQVSGYLHPEISRILRINPLAGE